MNKLPLDIDQIEAVRQGCRIGGKVVVFQSTGSTNDIAAEYAKSATHDGLCVLAEAQTKGRGRRGRTWHSEPGQSILCSVLLTKTPIEAELLTLTAAVATAEAINASMNNHGPLQCRIKWPNDILIRGQKVAGILIEKRTIKNRTCYIIGIGINCNQSGDTFDRYDLSLPATSLAIESNRSIDRTALVCEQLKQLELWLDNARCQERVIERWLTLSGMLGRHLTVECDGRQYSGFCRGIDPSQGLILQLDNSLVQMFSAAQTSIVPA